MKIEQAQTISLEEIKKEYRSYLYNQNSGRNSDSTIETNLTDAFYLSRHSGKDVFWKVITSENFEEYGRKELSKVLTEHSKGNVESLINGYFVQLRKLRDFIFSDAFNPIEVNTEEVLKDFLLDIDCLELLSKWTDKFNLFDVLKITRAEIRHSNMLAWLLSPEENHGLGDRVLKAFVQYVIKNFPDNKEVFSTLLMDFNDCEIKREWRHIDLLAISSKSKFVLCIENKIDTGEHDDQLERYKKEVEKAYPDYKKMYIYLSPNGSDSSNPEYWCSMSYHDVLEIIEKSIRKVDLSTDINTLVENYIEIIKRDILEDEELIQICRDIYRKHQKALDLIFENKPDKASDLADLFRDWAAEKNQKDQIIFDKENRTGKTIRFRTPTMDSVIPFTDEPNSVWKTKNHYFYFITNNNGKSFAIQFVVNSYNATDEQMAIFEKINELYPTKNPKGEKWQWRTNYSTKHSSVADEIDEEKICNQLDKFFEEILKFEKELTNKLNSKK